MPGALSLLFRQIAEVWRHFGINQKVSVVLALLFALTAIGGILYWSARPDYRLLYSGLTLEDAARAREKLEDERIPVQLRSHGQAIYVPASDVYRGRLLLATAGLPKDSAIGFELFEEPKFGLTEFAQQVNYQRALQGELERTIVAIDDVQAARVMLVMPRDRLFAPDREKSASASIMLTLRRGSSMSQNQVHSVRQLVSASVPGLLEGHITITDQQGIMLSDAAQTEDLIMGGNNRHLEIRRSVEDELARKAQDMLDLAIGPGQTLVRVSAELDFRRIERQSQTYDATGRVVVRETINSENTSEPIPMAGRGMARVAVDDPADVVMEQAIGQSRREDIDTEYLVPSGRETVVDYGGGISRLSVSVSVARGEEPREADEIQKIERMVRSAVGLVDTADRQDTIDVLEMAFPVVTAPKAPEHRWWEVIPFAPMAMLRFLTGAALILALYLFSRKTVRQLSIERETVGTPVSQLAGLGGAGGTNALQEDNLGVKPEARGDDSDFDHIARLAEQNPSAVASWIDQTVRNGGR